MGEEGATLEQVSRSRRRIIFPMVLVAILLFLLVGTVFKFTSVVRVDARPTAVKGHIGNYEVLLGMYRGANGVLPTTEQGLKSLVAKPEVEPLPQRWRQLLDAPIVDPWGQEYFYSQPGKHNPDGYDLFSAGPDKKPGTADDLGNWAR
jgi:general secretion pathway protein G